MPLEGINLISPEALQAAVSTSANIESAQKDFLATQASVGITPPDPVVLNTVDETGQPRGGQVDVPA